MGTRVSTITCLAALALAVVFAVSAPGIVAAQEPVKVVEIAVSGNQNINTDTIQNATTLKAGDDYTEQAVEKDRTAILSLGYFSAVTVHKDEVPGGVKITYEVTENSRISEIKVVGSDPVSAKTVIGLMKTKPGQVLNTTTLNQDIEAVQQYYGDQGYIAYVTEDIGIDPKTGVLTVPILVHTVESIEITGNKKTKTYVFLREMKTRPGNVFNVKVLKEDYFRIYNLDILEDIKNYQITPGSALGLVKITIPVVEKKTGQISVGFGYSSRQRLVGQARLSETNFRGKGQGLNVLWEQGTSQAVGGPSSYELGFYEPWIDSRHTSLSLSAFNKVIYRFSSGVFGSGDIAGDQTYNERHKGADATVSRPLTEKTRVYLGGNFQNVQVNPSLLNVQGAQDLIRIVQDGDVTSGSVRLVHNTRDFDLDPAAGQYDAISIQLGTFNGNRFGRDPNPAYNPDDSRLDPKSPDYDPGDPTLPPKYLVYEIPSAGAFRKLTVDLRRYFSRGGRKTNPNDRRTTLALRLMAGMGSGNLPFFEQFFVGGGETLRGYQEDRFWGNKMLLASIELRKPIAQSIAGVVFVDYGDAWDGSPEFFVTQFPQTESFNGNFGYGVGLRVNTPIGHIRLDYGIGSEGGRTHFSMGQAF